MTLYEFRLLTLLFQLQHVVTEGTYLAQRWESEQHRIDLYRLEDGGSSCLVEVDNDEALVELRLRRSFCSPVPRAAYRHRVQLPAG